ncbi:MAG: thrombospondin type 3 repeat-containing protein [Myxococcota bacterium]
MELARYSSIRLLLVPAVVALAACTPKAGAIGGLPEGASGDGGSGDGSSGGPGAGESDGGPGESGSTGDPPGSQWCDDPNAPYCCTDRDGDGVPLSMDNLPTHPNAAQGDFDDDGVADILDLCPTVESSPSNAADSDDDSIGNECDRCYLPASAYNPPDTKIPAAPAYMLVRNNPTNGDIDGDGVGDACDNCPSVANCLDLSPDNPHAIGEPIPDVEGAGCQDDSDGNGIGDACEGLMDEAAAGPVGFGPDDDFDQDGIVNLQDACPRLPLQAVVSCAADPNACPTGSECVAGVCNHVDADADGVGDACDSCPAASNPEQRTDAATDDLDGDFVGQACEPSPACDDRRSPRPQIYAPVSVAGACCVQMLFEDAATGDLYTTESCSVAEGAGPDDCAPLLAPDPNNAGALLPVRTSCSAAEQATSECLALPAAVAATPGVLTPPAGCADALADQGLSAVDNLTRALHDVESTLSQGGSRCALPPSDPDFDGVGSSCDLCALAFNPGQAIYVDRNGTEWPNDGALCNGPYQQVCE